DRRLGDYFTNTLDQNGCVLIATGDTMLTDPITGGQFSTGRPLFLQQASGPSLTTGQSCSSPLAVVTPEVPAVPALAAIAGLAGIAVVAARRRNRARQT